MLSKHAWDNIAQENYLRNVGPECTDIFLQENQLQFQISVNWAQYHRTILVLFVFLREFIYDLRVFARKVL